MSETPRSPDARWPSAQAADSRPASVWPDSTHRGPPAASAFVLTRFDPQADERVRLQQQLAATFDVCHPALALRAVLIVQGVLAIVALASAEGVQDWQMRATALAFAGVVGTLLWLVPLCAVRGVLHRLGSAARTAGVLVLGAVAALLGWAPLRWAGLAGETDALRLLGVLLSGAAFATLLWAWLELRARIWDPANASARLAELQSRIRPHFLFNALNTAIALVRIDPGRAEAVLEDLAQLFRVALADVGASVTLGDEIELARRYLAIEGVRFGERLQVEWRIDPRVRAARVPPLVLQPLVENAVRHGVEPSPDGGRVTVLARARHGQAEVLVTNTLADEPGNPGHGMALHNVRERLRLLHDVAADCTVWQADGLFHARLTLPLP
jgi:two-component system sensor histidine kinase AlgZ